MFQEEKDSDLLNFTTTFSPSECMSTIKSALELENFIKVNVKEEVNNIRSEHYNKKKEL